MSRRDSLKEEFLKKNYDSAVNAMREKKLSKDFVKLVMALVSNLMDDDISNAVRFFCSNRSGIFLIASNYELYPEICDLVIPGIDIASSDKYIDGKHVEPEEDEDSVEENAEKLQEIFENTDKNKITIVTTSFFSDYIDESELSLKSFVAESAISTHNDFFKKYWPTVEF